MNIDEAKALGWNRSAKRTRTLFAEKHLHDDDVAANMPGFVEGSHGVRIPVTVTKVDRLASGFITRIKVRDERNGDVFDVVRREKKPLGTSSDRFIVIGGAWHGCRLRLGRHETRGPLR